MHIDKYKQPDGTYLFEGMTVKDPVDLIQCHFLKFCACGMPEDNLDYVRRGLLLIDLRKEIWTDRLTMTDYAGLRHDLFGSESAALFFDYWADSMKLTEHGGGIGGAWLTAEGKELLEDLEELHKQKIIPQT